MDNKKNLNPILLITIVGIAIISLVVILIFVFNGGDDTENISENGDDLQQQTSQPSTKLTSEDLTSADLGLECTEDVAPTADGIKENITALEAHQINTIHEAYGSGDEGLNKYTETILQVQAFQCETDAGTQLEVVLSDQIEGSEFHDLISVAYILSSHPARDECAIGPYWSAKFANAVMSYPESVQRPPQASKREAHVSLLTEASESLGGELQDKCPEKIVGEEEDIAKTLRLNDIRILRAALNTYVGNNNGQLPTKMDDIRPYITSFSYYNNGNTLTNADVTAVGIISLTSTTASQFLFGDYNQVALTEAGLPDVEHFHIIFKASCNDTEEHSDYSTIGEGNSRSVVFLFRAEEDKVRCEDNL